MLSGSDYLMLYVALWIPAVAGCSFATYILLRRRMHAAERGERWASLTRWTDGAGADNWRLAANRGGVIILAVTLTMLGTAYLQRYMPVLIDRTPPPVWWTPFMFGSIYVFLVWMDWMSAKAIESGQTARLKATAVLSTALYALVSAAVLWGLIAHEPQATPPEVGEIWNTTNHLAETLKAQPDFNLEEVAGYMNMLRVRRATAYELYEIGAQRGIFLFRKRSYAGLRRWDAMDNLLEALAEDAKKAVRRGDWHRCREALRLALHTMEMASDLPVPEDLKPRLDPQMVPVRFFAMVPMIGGYQTIYPLLREIATLSPVHRFCMERALQQGRRVGEVLAESSHKSQPLLGAHLHPEQHRQMEIVADETLHRLSLELVRWEHSIDAGILCVARASVSK